MYQAVLNVPELSLVLRLKQLGTDNFNVRCLFNGEPKEFAAAAPRKTTSSKRPALIEQNQKPGQSKKLQKIDSKYTLKNLSQAEVVEVIGNNPKVIAGLANVRSKDEHEVFFIGDTPFGLHLDPDRAAKVAHKNFFLCLRCGKVLMRTLSMLAHAYSHIGVRQFPCTLCDKEYAYKSGLDRHCKKQHGVGGAPKPKSVAQHFTCPICQEGYEFKKSFDKHWRMNHKNSGRPLPIKTRVASTSSAPIPQIVEETPAPEDNRTACAICSKTFNSEKSLKLHFNTFHSSIYNFLCQYCFKGFYYKKDYDYHMKKEFKSQRIQKAGKENIPPFDEFLRCIIDN